MRAGELLFDQGQPESGGLRSPCRGRSPSSGRASRAKTRSSCITPRRVHVGETNVLAGHRSLVRARVGEDGEGPLSGPDGLPEDHPDRLGPQRAFSCGPSSCAAWAAHAKSGMGDAILIGFGPLPAGTLRLKEFFARNAHPFAYPRRRQGPDGWQALFDRFQHVAVGDVPVVICRDDRVLKNPSNEEVANCFGLSRDFDAAILRDVIVVGAGPAGLAAAVYAASGGARRARPREHSARRPGRDELEDRELPGFPDRDLGASAGPGAPSCRPRSSAPELSIRLERDAPEVRRPARFPGGPFGRVVGARAGARHRQRCVSTAAAAGEPAALGRGRRSATAR